MGIEVSQSNGKIHKLKGPVTAKKTPLAEEENTGWKHFSAKLQKVQKSARYGKRAAWRDKEHLGISKKKINSKIIKNTEGKNRKKKKVGLGHRGSQFITIKKDWVGESERRGRK